MSAPVTEPYRPPTQTEAPGWPRWKGFALATAAPIASAFAVTVPIFLHAERPWLAWLPIWLVALVLTGRGLYSALWKPGTKRPPRWARIAISVVASPLWMVAVGQLIGRVVHLLK
jgi:hypothetical protein